MAASALLIIANLRGLRESGTIFAVPTYVFVVHDVRADRLRAVSGSVVRRRRRLHAPPSALPARRRGARPLLPAVGVRPGLHGDDRHRGDLERRARLQAARGGRTRARRWCGWACCSARCSSGCRTWRCRSGCSRPRTRRCSRSLAERSSAMAPLWVVLQVATALILVLAANTVVRRLPAAGFDPGARPLPAAAVPVPRRSAGVHGRHRARWPGLAIVLLVVVRRQPGRA